MSTVADTASSVLQDYHSAVFESDADIIELVLKYTSDDWDSINDLKDPQKRVLRELERLLYDLQVGECQGRAIQCKSISEPTPLCDLYYVIVRIALSTLDDIVALMPRLLASPLRLPEEEILALRRKARKKREALTASSSTQKKVKHRWAL